MARTLTTSRHYRVTPIALLVLLLCACEAASDKAGGDATLDVVSTDAATDSMPGDVQTSDPGTDPAGSDLPPADLPADLPPTDVPPTDVPPTDTNPELVDEHCPTPEPFPEQCAEVSTFECGFLATCEGGVVHAEWHVHHFCSANDPLEDILPYACATACSHGCQEGTFTDWPQSGTELVALFCDQCAAGADCDALNLPHDDCVGAWGCDAGRCGWQCEQACVAEGASVAVFPNAPACCDGLGKVPCDAPDANGACQSCDGASVCVACGDGPCGLGENPCNCPADCPAEPVDPCALAGGQCTEHCNEGGMAEYVVEDAGCAEGSVCCVPDYDGCFGLGGGFLDFDTEGKCCEGLVASNDCDVQEDGSCSCPKCPCYLCLPCGDGVCGPFEHACNCPADCAPTNTVFSVP